MAKMAKKAVVKLVKSRLAKVGHGILFDLIEDGIRQDESWWYVPVIASRNGKEVPRETTIGIYANIENELEEKHDLSVLFVPAISEPSVS
jgi:hypothetical protein